MNTRVFNGGDFAFRLEQNLKDKVKVLSFAPRIASVVFKEDGSSQIYTRLKMEAAARVGIEFDRTDLSITDSQAEIVREIKLLSHRADLHGVMIQKPSKRECGGQIRNSPVSPTGGQLAISNYDDWWEMLTSAIDPKKDVDCLTRTNLDNVYRGESDFIPATAKAVMHILKTALKVPMKGQKIAVVGRSELVGKPLHYILEKMGSDSHLLGSKDNIKATTIKADIIISSTGVPNLITADMVKDGCIVVDVGEPKGDVDFERVKDKTSFITPVPDGVGPVTVISLLENLYHLVAK